MNIRLIFSLASLLLLMASCSKNVQLDNPGNAEVLFSVDGTEYRVPAKSTLEADIAPGRHALEIVAHGGDVIADTTIEITEGGLLHSGASQYIIWRQLYGLQDNRKELLNEEWLQLDSMKVMGDFKLYPKDVYYIESSWDTGILEDLPKESTLYITSDFVIKSKIFRLEDFIATYRALSSGS